MAKVEFHPRRKFLALGNFWRKPGDGPARHAEVVRSVMDAKGCSTLVASPRARVGRLLPRGALEGRPLLIPLAPAEPGRHRGELLQPLQQVFDLGAEGQHVPLIAVQREGLFL